MENMKTIIQYDTVGDEWEVTALNGFIMGWLTLYHHDNKEIEIKYSQTSVTTCRFSSDEDYEYEVYLTCECKANMVNIYNDAIQELIRYTRQFMVEQMEIDPDKNVFNVIPRPKRSKE